MRLNDWLTLGAIVTGPVLAVGLTLAIEEIRRKRERRLHIARLLLATRHMPADAQYNIAINLIPAEFHDQKPVMDAWRVYHDRVREVVPEAQRDDHQRRVNAAQSGMIHRIMHCVGLKQLSEGDIQTQVYISQGFVDRDFLYTESLRAMPEIAATLKRSSDLQQAIVDAIPPRPPPPPPAPPVPMRDWPRGPDQP